ncbi:SDR family oxidoreductase [Pendulispora albinea]|uniref:SDR family oxidoreductase n=1 Tax=Pendulispora albinea TaxID=2741071 RepID=A0ABZ2M0K1_9BACT
MTELTNRTVAIVGGSSGIGLATAKAAAARGAKVILLSRSQAKVDEAATSVGGEARAVALDMLDPEAALRVFGGLGTLDHLVLTAVADELARAGDITKLTPEQVERSFDKLRGFVNVTRAAVPHLQERGSITFLSGASAAKPIPRMSLLAAEAASVVSFGKTLALELAPVRVNVVMPGVVDTRIHTHQRETIRAFAESLPARHFGQPEDIAEGIVFLMTNPYVTGHTLVLDGGLLAS